MAAVFEMYDESGMLKMSSKYPSYQYVEKGNVPSFGDGLALPPVNEVNDTNWKLFKFACHLQDAGGQWVRYLFDKTDRLSLPAEGEPALILYDEQGVKPTFILKHPVLNIVRRINLGEPEHTPTEDYRTYKIPMAGRTYALSKIESSAPSIWSLHSTYVYHNQRYYNYNVTNYAITPVFDYAAQEIRFINVSDTYISYGHTTPQSSTDAYLTLSVLLIDVTGL